LDEDRETRNLFSALRHSYTPGPRLNAQDLLTYTRQELDDGFDLTSGRLQFNSYGFWRPVTVRPLTVNATLRTVWNENQNELATTNAYTATGTLGATYEWSPRWLFSGVAGVSGTEVDTEDADSRVSTFVRGTGRYTSRIYDWAGFDAGWFSQLDLANTTEDGDAIQSAGGELGYNLGRALYQGQSSSLRLNWTQSGGYLWDTDGFSRTRLRSNVSLGWNHRMGLTASMIRLSFQDNRTWAQDDDQVGIGSENSVFQLANLQASINRSLSRSSSVSGNLTVQATRDESPEIFGLTQEGEGEWVPTATADITYLNNRLFGVPRLNFRSTLRFVSNSYLPLLDSPDTRSRFNRDDRQWENRIEYYIGRLQVRGTARLTDSNGLWRTFFLVEVRRLFGDI
jgi:hypothetical protein